MNLEETSIIDKYHELTPTLELWGEFVDKTLNEILYEPFGREYKIKISIKHRLKSDKSFLSKVLYRNFKFDDPFIDIIDKVGTRIVLQTSIDVEKVTSVIKQCDCWDTVETRILRNVIESDIDAFTYQSQHIIVTPREPTFNNKSSKQLSCEIQIRTLLQHAYAEVSHDSTYKGPYKNDKEILRNLAKTMALMEVTDDYFCRIFELMSDVQRKYANFTSELIRIYASFDDNFKKEMLDIDVTDLIFKLLDLKDVPINDLEEFIIQKRTEISSVIQPSNGYIFQQPVFLLISFYFFRHKGFLRENWPLSELVLRSIFAAYNTAFE